MKLKQIQIQNFGPIGPEGCTVRMDNIVLLIGQNNVGKSTILDAYEFFARPKSKLTIEQFHKRETKNPVEISAVFGEVSEKDEETIGSPYVFDDAEFGRSVQVRCVWKTPDATSENGKFNPANNEWESGWPGGWETLLASRIPTPKRIRPSSTYEEQEKIVREILTSGIKEQKDSVMDEIIAKIGDWTDKLAGQVQEKTKTACDAIATDMKRMFPGAKMWLQPESGKFEPEKVLGAASPIYFAIGDEKSGPMKTQGTGVQRAFLWSAISAFARVGTGNDKKAKTAKSKGKVEDEYEDIQMSILLVDEPEAFLHPPLVRRAREALYALAESPNWQVMASTHSPILVDVAKPHTTIVRVENSQSQATRTFVSEREAFDAAELEQLRMIRSCHPTVNELFFADHVVLVEGETEHAVLNRLLPGEDFAVCVINCMGKGNIPMFQRILNHFQLPYTVLHDSDAPRRADGAANGMWTMNQRILDAAKDAPSGCSLVVHVPGFEHYYFGEGQDSDKPANAILHFQRSDYETAADLARLRSLKDQILTGKHPMSYQDEKTFVALVAKDIRQLNLHAEDAWRDWLAEKSPLTP